MTKREWTIIGLLGAIVVVVLACLGGLMLTIVLTSPPRQVERVAVSDLPSVTPAQLPTQLSPTQVKPTTPPQPTAQRLSTATALPTTTKSFQPTVTATPDSVAPPFKQICNKDETMTGVQVEEELKRTVGKKVVDWQGWVYDVSQTGSNYKVQIAMESPSALFWSRDIEIIGVSRDTALRLSKKQMVTFSGTIQGFENAFGVYCNPLIIEKATIK
jgi:hypothetical protein